MRVRICGVVRGARESEVIERLLRAEGHEVLRGRAERAHEGDDAALLVLFGEGRRGELVGRCRALAAASPDAEILVVVEAPDPALCASLLTAGASAVLGRPLEEELVRAHVRAAQRRRLRAAERHGATEELLRSLIHCATDAIFVKDRGGRYLLMNPSGARLFGKEASEILGHTDAELFDEAAARQIRATDERVMSSGAPLTYEQTRVINGREVVFFTAKYPYRTRDGATGGVMGISHDITERKQLQLQAQLLLADRIATVSSLSAGVAYAVRNPLQAIMSSLELLELGAGRARTGLVAEGSADGGAAAGGLVDGDLEPGMLIARAQEGCERILHLVEDLAIYARDDGGGDGPVDVERVVETALRLMRHALHGRARLVRDHARTPPVSANASRLGQVIVNLLANAMQAFPADRPAHTNEIRILTSAARGRVLIAIADNGVGMSRELMARIFDPFFTPRPVGASAGMGLFLCRDIVSRLGGELTVESQPGEGTVFRLWLPARVHAEDAAAALPG